MRVYTPQMAWHVSDDDHTEAVLCVDLDDSGRVATGALCMYNCDATHCVAGGMDAKVQIWRFDVVETKVDVRLVAQLAGHDKAVNCVRFAPTPNRLASGSSDGSVFVWRCSNQESKDSEVWCVEHRLCSKHEICDLNWSVDGAAILTGSIDNEVQFWCVRDNATEIVHKHTGFVQGVACDPLMTYVASQSTDRTCCVFANKKLCKRPRKQVSCSSFHLESQIKFLPQDQADQGKALMYVDESHAYSRRLAFSPDGSLLVSPAGVAPARSGFVYTTWVFVRNELSRPALSLPSVEPSFCVRFSPVFYQLRHPPESLGLDLRFRMVFAVALARSVVFYDTEQVNPIAMANDIHFAAITDIAWSADGRVLVATSKDAFCSFIVFAPNELGEPIPEAQRLDLQRRMRAYTTRDEPGNHTPQLSFGSQPATQASILQVRRVQKPKK